MPAKFNVSARHLKEVSSLPPKTLVLGMQNTTPNNKQYSALITQIINSSKNTNYTIPLPQHSPSPQ